MHRIGVKRQFSAAHYLQGQAGKCSRMHGHTWEVEAVFKAGELGTGGLVVDFADVGEALEDAIEAFDHVCLNDVKPFDVVEPTAENVARELFARLEDKSRPASWQAELESVTVWESRGAWASFTA
jgi:6-pyruvoyltetrahydropterin/6-carboxytetrahydropterin synthase